MQFFLLYVDVIFALMTLKLLNNEMQQKNFPIFDLVHFLMGNEDNVPHIVEYRWYASFLTNVFERYSVYLLLLKLI